MNPMESERPKPSTPPASAAAPSIARIGQVDAIRALAILAVIIWHYAYLRSSPVPGTLYNALYIPMRLTWTGVDLFFVLSGFLIGSILLVNRGQANYFKKFYIRRVCRILPLYYIVIGLCAAMRLPAIQERAPALSRIFDAGLPYWTFFAHIQNLAMAHAGTFAGILSMTWSLAVEEQFYLVLPLLVHAIQPRRLPLVLVALVAATPFIRLWTLNAFPAEGRFLCYISMPCRWDGFFLGVLVAWCFQDPDWKERIRRRLGVCWSIFAVLGAGMFYLAASGQGAIMSETVSFLGYTWIALFYAALIVVGMLSPNAILRRFLLATWLRWIGIVSYGIYLLHEIINFVLFQIVFGREPEFKMGAYGALTLLSLALTLVLAALSARFIEAPFIRFSHRAGEAKSAAR